MWYMIVFKKIWKVKQVIKAFWILVLIQMISKVSYPFKINAYKTTTIPILYKIIYCANKSWRQSEYYVYIFVVTFLRKTVFHTPLMPLFEVILKQSIPHQLQLFAYFVISMSLCLKELFSSCKMVLHRECPPRAMPIKFLKGYKIYAATCHR